MSDTEQGEHKLTGAEDSTADVKPGGEKGQSEPVTTKNLIDEKEDKPGEGIIVTETTDTGDSIDVTEDREGQKTLTAVVPTNTSDSNGVTFNEVCDDKMTPTTVVPTPKRNTNEDFEKPANTSDEDKKQLEPVSVNSQEDKTLGEGVADTSLPATESEIEGFRTPEMESTKDNEAGLKEAGEIESVRKM